MSIVYGEQEVQSWLATNLTSWQFEDGHLTRSYTTRNWHRTLMLANTIGFMAEAGWHHPELILSYARLTVRLQTHDADGITDKDLEMARRIEEIATWQPGSDAALTGNPNRWIA